MPNSNKINVIFVIPDFLSGGAQKQCALLYSKLRGDDEVIIHLVHVWDGPNIKWVNDGDENVIKINRKKLSDFRIIYDLMRIVKKTKAEVVVSWLHPADTYCWVLKLFFRGTAWIMTERDSSYPNSWKYNLRKYFGRYSDVILANSEKGFYYWEEQYKENVKIKLVNNICAFDGELIAKINRDFDVISIGRLEPQKNIKNLVDAITVWSNRSGGHAVLGGSGSLDSLVKSMVSGVDGVHYKGYIDNPAEFLRGSKIFISMSLHEGTPNSLVEAIVSGCIVVASKIPEHVSILGENYPFLVDLNSEANAVADVIDAALVFFNFGQDKKECVMSNAINKIRKMSPDFVANQYKEVFRGVVRKNA